MFALKAWIPMPLSKSSISDPVTTHTKASAEKISGGGPTEKTRSKNSTIKPPFTLSIPSMKIQGRALLPAADAHAPHTMMIALNAIF